MLKYAEWAKKKKYIKMLYNGFSYNLLGIFKKLTLLGDTNIY